MILKDIASEINMDISTVSRVANSKSIQTEFGIFPLKYFFSEGISTESGDDVSSREVKHHLKDLIDQEDKKKPLSDDKLEKLLKAKGYNIARRTVAKVQGTIKYTGCQIKKRAVVRDRFAKYISIVFHPLLMPTYLFLFMMFFASSLLSPCSTRIAMFRLLFDHILRDICYTGN